MRLDIHSENRLGITQEILTTIVNKGWDISSAEMYTHHTFVHINKTGISVALIAKSLLKIPGVINVTEVAMCPNEEKRMHLDTMLSKLPDPIIDIDCQGKVIVANMEAEKALGLTKENIEGKNITSLMNLSLSQVLIEDPKNIDLTYAKKQFIVEISPVFTSSKVTGAVIILRTPQSIGKQISAIQPNSLDSIESIIGHSVKMKNVKQQTLRFANLDLPVLLQGETGTGKELFARALHESSTRKKAPFLAINCAALPENLLESELFGYAPGAFSGAQRNGKPGLFELAENGTIFLDEIGEMSIYLQAKLLRFLQDYSFRRIGGTNEISVNVRIVCATHRHLEKLVVDNLFREDLFYRLNVLALELPPLRERIEDIYDLVNFFTIKAAEQIDIPPPSFTHSAIKSMESINWPGNIRQLQNIIFKTLALTDKKVIDKQDICFSTKNTQSTVDAINDTDITTLDFAVEQFEKSLLQKLYQSYPSTRKLAQRLSVSHAKISRKLRKYGINNVEHDPI